MERLRSTFPSIARWMLCLLRWCKWCKTRQPRSCWLHDRWVFWMIFGVLCHENGWNDPSLMSICSIICFKWVVQPPTNQNWYWNILCSWYFHTSVSWTKLIAIYRWLKFPWICSRGWIPEGQTRGFCCEVFLRFLSEFAKVPFQFLDNCLQKKCFFHPFKP